MAAITGIGDAAIQHVANERFHLADQTAGCRQSQCSQRFESPDGRAVLSIYSRGNDAADTPVSYLRKNLRQSGLDYPRVTRSFFAISMERDGRIYYSRCNFSRSAKGVNTLF